MKRENYEDKILHYCSVIIIFIFLVVVCALILPLGIHILAGKDTFCSTNDPVYQAISANGSTWAVLASTNVSTPHFSVPGDSRIYYAEGYSEMAGEKLVLFYVLTGSDSASVEGSEGYLYVPSDELSSPFWFANYWIKHLSDHIYCYRL